MAISESWQIEMGGVQVGPGSRYVVEMVDGLGLPDVRATSVPKAQQHGSFASDAEFYDERLVAGRIRIVCPEPGGVDTAGELLDALKAAWGGGTVLRVFAPGWSGVRRLTGRHRRLPADTSLQKVGLIVVDFQFSATDPHLYADDLSSEVIGLPSGSGGVLFPATFPLVFGASSVGGLISATNEGTAPSKPVATIAGPVTNPRIENVTTGQTLKLEMTLGAGEFVEVDFDAQSILLAGTASRRSAMSADSAWWALAPGANEIRYQADAYEAASRLTLSWRHAWI